MPLSINFALIGAWSSDTKYIHKYLDLKREIWLDSNTYDMHHFSNCLRIQQKVTIKLI